MQIHVSRVVAAALGLALAAPLVASAADAPANSGKTAVAQAEHAPVAPAVPQASATSTATAKGWAASTPSTPSVTGKGLAKRIDRGLDTLDFPSWSIP